MELDGEQLRFSATDIAGYLGCAHLTMLERRAALGGLRRPIHRDPFLDMLRDRGLAHEKAYIAALGSDGVVDLSAEKRHAVAERETHAALARGARIVVQGALSHGRFRGRPDVLIRIDRPSASWAWAYEVHDTKLTENTRAGAILQLCLYWRALATQQGPDAVTEFFIKTPRDKHAYRALDYTAYFDMICGRLVAMADDPATQTYPEPVEHCAICPWFSVCDAQRRADDHIGFVARLSTSQRKELAKHSLTTLTALGQATAITFKPRRGHIDTYERSRAQASIQLRGRGWQPPLHELLAPEPNRGFALLPEPTAHDVFIDFEGDPFALPHGREYMLGIVDRQGNYQAYWALEARDERTMFERVITELGTRLAHDPAMHVYHYAPYEPAAFKRLAQRYGVQQEVLDRFLRGERFIDVYKVVTQSLRAGVESYSLKEIEKLAGFTRSMPLTDASKARRRLELALETGHESAISDDDRSHVERYNEDDCRAVLRLAEWLEAQRDASIARPLLKDLEVKPETQADRDAREQLRQRLLEGVPDVERSSDQQAHWLMAQLLDFHRREENVKAWERFHRGSLYTQGDFEALLDDKEALAYLQLSGEIGRSATGIPIHRYSYPPQDCDMKKGDDVAIADKGIGKVVAIDRLGGTIDIQKTKATASEHPPALFTVDHTNTQALKTSLAVLAERLLARETNAALRLLSGTRPMVDLTARPEESSSALATRVAIALQSDVLPIQGPPGAGKTYTAAKMIVALVAAGKKVGVTSNSHKAIRNLLLAVHRENDSIRLAHRCDDDYPIDAGIEAIEETKDARKAIRAGNYDVLGGTAWVWSNERDLVDVLFVDEAGQMALANVLASASAADSLVLLGDPQQLEQPTKAAHPDGVAISALEHLFGNERTVPPGRGIFLDVTYRLPPDICAFTSELFYESQLKTQLAARDIRDCGPISSGGLWLVPCEHDGNRNASDEEVEVVARLVELVEGGTWAERRLTKADIMVIAPYNAQVTRLKARLPELDVGTVDLFQGREAPIVIFSMATSTAAEAPRGMEFLFSSNRLNVATSRARAACILVANPTLFVADCRTPEQVKLLNAFCRYREQAKQLSPTSLELYADAPLPSQRAAASRKQ